MNAAQYIAFENELEKIAGKSKKIEYLRDLIGRGLLGAGDLQRKLGLTRPGTGSYKKKSWLALGAGTAGVAALVAARKKKKTAAAGGPPITFKSGPKVPFDEKSEKAYVKRQRGKEIAKGSLAGGGLSALAANAWQGLRSGPRGIGLGRGTPKSSKAVALAALAGGAGGGLLFARGAADRAGDRAKAALEKRLSVKFSSAEHYVRWLNAGAPSDPRALRLFTGPLRTGSKKKKEKVAFSPQTKRKAKQLAKNVAVVGGGAFLGTAAGKILRKALLARLAKGRGKTALVKYLPALMGTGATVGLALQQLRNFRTDELVKRAKVLDDETLMGAGIGGTIGAGLSGLSASPKLFGGLTALGALLGGLRVRKKRKRAQEALMRRQLMGLRGRRVV